MNKPLDLSITLTFTPEDLAHLNERGIQVPNFWEGRSSAPVVGDMLRFAGLRFVIKARVWEHNGTSPVLRLYMSDRETDTGTVLH